MQLLPSESFKNTEGLTNLVVESIKWLCYNGINESNTPPRKLWDSFCLRANKSYKEFFKDVIQGQEMISISAYQRILWFHNRVAGQTYPNARTLSEYFEISTRQAQRDIEYLRDSMNAPLAYSAKKRGYTYCQEYSLPSYFLSEIEKGLLHTLTGYYSQIGSYGYRKYDDYANLLSKLFGSKEEPLPSSVKEPYIAELKFLEERISATPLDYFICQRKSNHIVSYAFYDPDIFMSVLLGCHLKFQVLKPKWLKAHIKNWLAEVLSTL